MSKTMRTTPIWLGKICSKMAFLSVGLAIVPIIIVEHFNGKRFNIIKYLQGKVSRNKHAEPLGVKSGEFVQGTLQKEVSLVDH